MVLLGLGLFLFLAAHSVSIFGEKWRDQCVARLGQWPWKGLYSVISIVGLVLLVKGYAVARQDPFLLYAPPIFLRHGAMALMLPVFPLLVSSYFPGRIRSLVRHPTLVATELWATAHLLANGMLADSLLFGAILAWALLDHRSMRRRTIRTIPGAPISPLNDVIAIVVGLGIYISFMFWLHVRLIGVPVI